MDASSHSGRLLGQDRYFSAPNITFSEGSAYRTRLYSMAVTELVVSLFEVQEFTLFFFFCVGFFVFRLERLQRRVCHARRGVSSEGMSQQANETRLMKHTIERLRSDFDHRCYAKVVDDWESIYPGSRTIDSLRMVLQALLVLGRPEDTGLVLAKAAAHASQELADLMHEAIEAVANPDVDVNETHIAVAARDMFDQARGQLGASGTKALMLLLAKNNDEIRVAGLLQRLEALGAPASSGTIAALSRRFLTSGNLDAALSHLDRAISSSTCGQECSVPQALVLDALRRAVEVVDAQATDRALLLVQAYPVKIDDALVNSALRACAGLESFPPDFVKGPKS